MPRRVLAILNPVSGRRSVLSVVRRVGRLIEQAGGSFDVAETAGACHATEIASRIGPDTDGVLAVGGDGTAFEVANGLIGKNVPIVLLGTGTENLLARELGMPTTPTRVARTLLHGQPFAYDVGVVNDRRFLVVTGIGFDAECVVRMSRIRRGHITHWDFFWPIWRTFWAHRFPLLHVEADGECVFEGRGLAFVGVIGHYSAGLRILARARYDDGLLDLCVFPCRSRMTLTAHALRLYRLRHVDRGGVIYRQCRRIRITSPEPVPIETDGELGGTLPADCSILPGACRFLRLEQGNGTRISARRCESRHTKQPGRGDGM